MVISFPKDANRVAVLGGVSSADGTTPVLPWVDPSTHRLLVDNASSSGTVTSVATGTGLTGGPITATGTISLDSKLSPMDTLTGNSLKVLRVNAGETAVEYATSSSGLTVGTTAISGGTDTRVLYDNAGVLGELTNTGTGTVNVLQTTPTLITPVLGVATATSINKVAITAPATSSTLTVADGKTLTASNSITLAGTDGKGINVGAATSGKILTGDGTNMVLSTPTFPNSATTNKILVGDGTNIVLSTPTFPNASATSGKVIKSDGTNWVASTETYAVPGTSGNLLTSDGTNWTSAAPAGSGAMTLLKANSGQTVNITAAPTEFDNVAISGLTAKDTLVIYCNGEFTVQGTGGIFLSNSTDTVNLTSANIFAGTSGTNAVATIFVRQSRSANTKIQVGGFTTAVVGNTATFTTAWTGSWTLSFRSTTATNGGTVDWSWAVYKIAGQ